MFCRTPFSSALYDSSPLMVSDPKFFMPLPLAQALGSSPAERMGLGLCRTCRAQLQAASSAEGAACEVAKQERGRRAGCPLGCSWKGPLLLVPFRLTFQLVDVESDRGHVGHAGPGRRQRACQPGVLLQQLSGIE